MVDPSRVWKSKTLPSLPTVAVRLLEIAASPEVDFKEVVKLVGSDAAIAAKILRASNSSYFGVRAEVTSIDQAVALLGTSTVASLALSFSLAQNAMAKGPLAERFREYWRKSIVQACAAEIIGNEIAKGLGAENFVTGLLIDIGHLAMLKTVPEEFAAVLDRVEEERRDLVEVERQLLGFDHVEVSAKLLENWSLPASIVEAARLQAAEPDALAALPDTPESRLCRAAAVASTTGDYFCSVNNGPSLDRLRHLCRAFAEMDEARLHVFVEQVRERVEQAGDLFNVDMSEIGSPADLMSAASEHLAMLAVQAQAASVEAEVRGMAAEMKRRDLEQQNRELRQQSVRDVLTRLYNRGFFEESLDREVERCRRTAQPFAVLFSDIDHFKNVNDTHGHQFGDQVLTAVAGAFEETVRKSDVVARYGGEEFVVLLPSPTEKGVLRLAERLRERVESLEFQHEGVDVPVTVSIGAAWAVPGHDEEDDIAEQVVALADEAMYEAKRNGRNQVSMRGLVSEFERQVLRMSVTSRFSRWLVTKGHFDVPSIAPAILDCQPNDVSMGELAVRYDMLSESSIDRIVAQQGELPGLRFGEVAHRLKLLAVEQVGWLLGQQQESVTDLAALVVEHGLASQHVVDEHRNAYLAQAPLSTQRPAVV